MLHKKRRTKCMCICLQMHEQWTCVGSLSLAFAHVRFPTGFACACAGAFAVYVECVYKNSSRHYHGNCVYIARRTHKLTFGCFCWTGKCSVSSSEYVKFEPKMKRHFCGLSGLPFNQSNVERNQSPKSILVGCNRLHVRLQWCRLPFALCSGPEAAISFDSRCKLTVQWDFSLCLSADDQKNMTEQHTTNPIQNILIEVESHASIFIAAQVTKEIKNPKKEYSIWILESRTCVCTYRKGNTHYFHSIKVRIESALKTCVPETTHWKPSSATKNRISKRNPWNNIQLNFCDLRGNRSDKTIRSIF